MPFRRAGFALTPPSLPIFAISLVLALIAILARYDILHIPMLTSARAFLMLVIAYVVLAIGVLVRRV
jgi:hypothetical protein